jgi:DNA-directed RNA polymerase specialized sigma24 family protein
VVDVHLPATPSSAARPFAGPDERQLIAQISNGSQAALEKLYGLYRARLTSFFLLLTSNADLNEEMISDTLFDVWRECASLGRNMAVPVWVMSLAYRHADLHLAAAAPCRRQLQSPVTGADHGCSESTTGKNSPCLHDVIRGLSFLERAVFFLAYAIGHSRQDIASIMNVSSCCVDMLLASARHRLRFSTENRELTCLPQVRRPC